MIHRILAKKKMFLRENNPTSTFKKKGILWKKSSSIWLKLCTEVVYGIKILPIWEKIWKTFTVGKKSTFKMGGILEKKLNTNMY